MTLTLLAVLMSVLMAGVQPMPPVELTVASRDATLATTMRFPATGRGPFPAIVLVHGSGPMTRDQLRPLAERFLSMGVAVLSYDKRGVGQSTGTYVNVGTARSVEVFGQLADDALACVEALQARQDVDARRIGLGGASQAGWIVPLAASRSRDVAFLVILSGPAVTVGEEIEYSRLAGSDPGSIRGWRMPRSTGACASLRGRTGTTPSPCWRSSPRPRSGSRASTIAACPWCRRSPRSSAFGVRGTPSPSCR